jgi:hypothetical protein
VRNNLRRKIEKTVMAEKEIQNLGDVLKLAAYFIDMPPKKAKNYALKIPDKRKKRKLNFG